jgi:hypothetical protein
MATSEDRRNVHRRVLRYEKKLKRERELENLMKIISGHPGYTVSLFGVLSMRTTEHETIEVDWEVGGKRTETKSFQFESLRDLKKACLFFIEKRHALLLGTDHEYACATCLTPLEITDSHPKNRAGRVFCDERCRRNAPVESKKAT